MPSRPSARLFPQAAPSGGVAPLVGRAAELSALTALVERAGRLEAGPRLALVGGDPGVGKSRLLQAVAVEAAASGCLVLTGRASDGSGPIPYALLADALAPALGRASATHRPRTAPNGGGWVAGEARWCGAGSPPASTNGPPTTEPRSSSSASSSGSYEPSDTP